MTYQQSIFKNVQRRLILSKNDNEIIMYSKKLTDIRSPGEPNYDKNPYFLQDKDDCDPEISKKELSFDVFGGWDHNTISIDDENGVEHTVKIQI